MYIKGAIVDPSETINNVPITTKKKRSVSFVTNNRLNRMQSPFCEKKNQKVKKNTTFFIVQE